jgi:aryl-alcohol dehydrogenase-like predicted oxidoreductase
MRISILGFGCGAVGGLMVRGDPADQRRAIARALEAGVNYFDTAVQYGDGESCGLPSPNPSRFSRSLPDGGASA